jgi:hypothetical protein
MSKCALIAILSLALASVPSAAQKAVGEADILKASMTIQSIDRAQRLVTLRDDSGLVDTVHLGPEVKRFSELKVGDRVNLTYYQSRILELRKRGTETGPVGTTGTQVARSQGALPAAAVARQATAVVTVISTDLINGLIGVRTDDGRTIRRKVEDRSLLNGIVADDKIEVTYTQALLVEIDR